MKKNFLLFCFLTFTASAQNLYYDAVQLRDSLKCFKTNCEWNDHISLSILALYLGRPTEGENPDDYYPKVIGANPFLKSYKFNVGEVQSTSEELKPSVRNFSNSLSGLNVTTFADGLAKFLVERAKQELSTSFFAKFKTDLNNYPDLKELFPSTTNWLNAIDIEIYDYSGYITMLREAFIKDFQVIIPNLKKVVNDPRHKDYFENNKPLKEIISIALTITESFQRSDHPGEILHRLALEESENLFTIDKNLKPSVQLFDFMIQSLRSKSPDSYLVPFDSIKQVLFNKENDYLTFRIYMGLLYERTKEIKFTVTKGAEKKDTTVGEFLTALAKEIKSLVDKFEPTVKELVSKGKDIQISLNDIEQKKSSRESTITYVEYFNFYNSTISFLEYASSVPASFNITVPWTDKKDIYFSVARKMGEMYFDINEKKYASAILNLSMLYTTVLSQGSTKEDLEEKIAQLKKEIEKAKDNVESLNLRLEKLEKELLKKQLPSLLLKYGNFASQIIAAENSDQVKAAIETVALPAGSSSIKRKSKSNVALNSFLGLSPIGVEWNGDFDTGKYSFGISAPIGIAFSKGKFETKEKQIKEKGSCSLFLSVIDLGAITAFRFNDSTTEELPKFTFQNILAPGIYYVKGFANTPLSLGLGGQFGPQLRKITGASTDINDGVTFSFKVFLSVDIPLINFSTKPR